MNVRRLASTTGALAVGGIAAIASYKHQQHLAVQYGQDPLIAAMLPFSVDGMVVVATVALGDGRRYRWSAWMAFWTGVGATVTANVLAAQPSTIARCISAWPAIAFLLVVEVITRGGRDRSAPVKPVPAPAPEPVPASVAEIVEPPLMAAERAWSIVETDPGTASDPEPAPEGVPAASNGKRRPPVPDRRILASLRDPEVVPRRPDGTVAIRELDRRWGCRPPRAVRLLREAGVYREGEAEGVPAEQPEPVPAT